MGDIVNPSNGKFCSVDVNDVTHTHMTIMPFNQSYFSDRQNAIAAHFLLGFCNNPEASEADLFRRQNGIFIYNSGANAAIVPTYVGAERTISGNPTVSTTWDYSNDGQVRHAKGVNLADNNGTHLYLCRTQNRCMDLDNNGIKALLSGAFTFNARFVITDWWSWSCDCSVQYWKNPGICQLLTDWYNVYGANANFRIVIHFYTYAGFNDGLKIVYIGAQESGGWTQIDFNGDAPSRVDGGASTPEAIYVQQYDNANNTWRTRASVAWVTKNYACSWRGNGTYYPSGLEQRVPVGSVIAQNIVGNPAWA